jgi:DNA-binding MarR family transcriptional regulator
MKPEETIDFHIRWAWFNISRMYNIEAAKYGGSMAIGYTLLNIDTKEGTPSTKLGPKMGMESRSLTRMIKSLEEKGVIYKKVDENDRRMVRLFLTDIGQDMRTQAILSVHNFNEKIQSEIPQEDLEKTFEVLGKLNNIIDKNNIFNN